MRNLIKNVVRSFKNNKISIIGLIFLLFFGLGAFCVMNNTTTNITNEYTSLANRGKLHDFIASELYEVGSASYTTPISGIQIDVTGTTDEPVRDYTYVKDLSKIDGFNTNYLYTGSTLPITPGATFYIGLPNIEHFGTIGSDETFISTYHIVLDEKTSSGLYQQFAVARAGTRYVDYELRISSVYKAGQARDALYTKLSNLLDAQKKDYPESSWPTLAQDNVFSVHFQQFSQFINSQTQLILSLMTTKETPLSLKLEKEYANEVDYRFFKSLNVTATKDNIFYKIIDSNPEDNIDTMVLFSDPVGRTGNHLFSVDDWAPYNSPIVIYNLDNEPIEPGSEIVVSDDISFTIPSDFNDIAETKLYPWEELILWNREARFAYAQILQIRFKRMLAADRSTDALDGLLKTVAAPSVDPLQYPNLFYNFPDSGLAAAYNDYLTYWYNGAGESITISSNGNVVFSWVEALGTPQTCTISNWTSRFSVINPQHLKKNDKRVLDPSLLNEFEPFKAWYKATYDTNPYGNINQKVAKAWFNSLNQNQFGFWIDPTTKDEWNEMSYEIPGQEDPIIVKRSNWKGINKEFIASCGGYNQIIWGCGLTPDFMYPVVDITRPTPNTKTECLVYCNEAGYYTIKLAFVNSAVEDYLIARFKPNVNTNRQQEIVKAINVWAHDNMIYPDNVDCCYFADDVNNILNCSGYRVSYLPRLVGVVELVSAILCGFIAILCLIICFVIIKRYVERNRVNIGIMRANGIKKWKIAVSLLPFAFFPAMVGGISAYLTGLGLQAAALTLFSSYWMLPTPLIKFNWISFLSAIFIPFIIFGAICWITTLIVLRVNSVELMKPGSEFKANGFSRIAKKPFKHFGVLTRFRVALAFNSIYRLLMLAAMSCLTMSSLVFAMTTFDKLNQSRVLNSSQFDYSFNVELTTPTTGGSIYSTFDYSALQEDYPDKIQGLGWSNPEQYIFNVAWDTTAGTEQDVWATEDGVNSYTQFTKPYSRNTIVNPLTAEEGYADAVGHYGNLMLPNSSDATGQNEDLLFLQNKSSARLTLDYSIGLPGVAASNPWEIALALMPANSRNIAADSYNSIINEVGHKVYDAHQNFINIARTKYELTVNDDGYIAYVNEAQKQAVHAAASEAGKWYGLGVHYQGFPILDPAYWYSEFPQFFTYVEDEKGERTYSLKTEITEIGYLFSSFKTDFIDLLTTIYSDKDMVMKEYPISYGLVPLNWDLPENGKKDETYTYVLGNINKLSNNHHFDSTLEIKVEGITDNSQYIKLTDKKGNDLNKWLFDQDYLQSQQLTDNMYPVIVNAFAAHKYNLKTGDVITLHVNNTVDRFEQKLHSNKYPKDYNDVQFKVVGISQGTNGEAYYTTQEIANNVLGLPNGKTWNKTHKYMMWTEPSEGTWPEWETKHPLLADLSGIGASDDNHITKYKFADGQGIVQPVMDDATPRLTGIKVPVGFNGIYTTNKTGKPITAGISLYSYTGMYPGTSVYKSNGSNNKFAQILTFGNNLSIANLMTGINEPEYYEANARYIQDHNIGAYLNKINKFINTVSEVYGDTTMITAICGGMDVAASDLVYSNLISTFDLAETSIMSIIIPITIIIVAIISNLIITDSKRMAAMMKALGYSDAKNLMSILALFVPTIVLGLALAVPLSFGLTLGYQAIIFNTANILVDVTQKWWFYIAAIGGIGVILIGSYAVGYISLKRDRLVDQIK